MSQYELKLKAAQDQIEMAREDAADGEQAGSHTHLEIAQGLLKEAASLVRA